MSRSAKRSAPTSVDERANVWSTVAPANQRLPNARGSVGANDWSAVRQLLERAALPRIASRESAGRSAAVEPAGAAAQGTSGTDGRPVHPGDPGGNRRQAADTGAAGTTL